MELLDELREFSGIYHEYVQSCSRLASQNRLYNDMVKLTPNGYFEASDDALMRQVREARSAIERAQRRMADLRASLPQKEHQLQSSLAQNSGQRAQLESQISGRNNEATKKKLLYGLLWFFIVGPLLTGIPLFVLNLIVTLTMGPDTPVSLVLGIAQPASVVAVTVLIVARISKKAKAENESARSEISRLDAADAQAHAQFQNEVARINAEIAELERSVAQNQAFLEQRGGEARGKAGDMWVSDLRAEGSKLSEAVGECQALRSRLASAGTIADEDDWYAVDSLVKLINSGRASDLKEALRLFDEKERHSQVMMAHKAQFDQGEALRREVAAGLGSLLQNQEYLIQQAERHHDESMGQRERQHAEQMRTMNNQLDAQRDAAAAAAIAAAAAAKTAYDAGNIAADVRDIKNEVSGGR